MKKKTMKKKTVKQKLVPVLISALCVFNSGQSIASQKDKTENTPAMTKEEGVAVGVGAMSGASIAGPVGFLVGGLVGVLFNHDNADESSGLAERTQTDETGIETAQIDEDIDTHSDTSVMVSDTGKSNKADDLLLASASNNSFLVKHDKPADPDKLKEIITDRLNFVVYFTPGSVTTADFYEEQFATVLDLLREMPKIELSLAGYSDRRGTKAENVQLASQRIASIREYFIQHGIDEHRIKLHAYGEKDLLSTAGELDSYMFDRRVVLSFNQPNDNSKNNIAVVEPVRSTEQTNASPF